MEEMDHLRTLESTWMGGASSMPNGESTKDDEQAILEFRLCPFGTVAPSDAAGQSNKRTGSPPVVRDGKRLKSLDNGGVSGRTTLCEADRLQRSSEGTELLLTSCNPTEAAACGKELNLYGSRQNVQHIRSFSSSSSSSDTRMRSSEARLVKHKIFLSHAGAQKAFVEELYVDLEARGYFSTFFDQREQSLPKGKDFAPLIKEAAQQCHVAVVVLSEEFLCSKWPMIELAEFHGAQQAGNHRLNMLPLFYKLSVDDLSDQSIEDRWMPKWRQYANDDKRIDVAKWSAAVRALRKVNGLIFHKKGMSEEAYRKDVVRSIFRLSPSELLYGSSRDMLGYSRICQEVSSRFVEDARVGAGVLGLYGTSGVGKTTLCKALCDYFSEEFLGRVCYVDVGETSRMGMVCHAERNKRLRLQRAKLILERICGLDKDALGRIKDSGQALTQILECMKREPLFLAIDNVTNDLISRREVEEYLTVGFHPESRIMITSRSEVVVQDLLPGVKFCMPMPRLSMQEAGAIFLRSAAPMKSISALTDEEIRILGLCIQLCLFESDEGGLRSESGYDALEFLSSEHVSTLGWKSYHPLALLALGDFFYRSTDRSIEKSHMLGWKDQLEKNEVCVKDVWKKPSIRSIIGAQFSTLDPSEQLLFLDVALYINYCSSAWLEYDVFTTVDVLKKVDVLCGLHEEARNAMKRRLRDLNRSGMINFFWDEDDIGSILSVHDLYREFAEWYVTEHEAIGLKNAWAMFRTSGTSLGCNPPTSKCWSDLVRLRLFDLTRANARFVASKTMQELHNLVVLQLRSCTYSTALNLEGLDSLHHLELVKLTRLVTVTLSGSSSTNEKGGIYESLRIVLLEKLESLTHVPDFRSCTSLDTIRITRCERVTNFEGVECPHLKELELWHLVPHQWARLPNVKSLHSLTHFFLRADFHVYRSDVCWWFAELELREPKSPVFKILKEALLDWVEDGPPLDREVYSDEKDYSNLLWWIDDFGGIEGLLWEPKRPGLARYWKSGARCSPMSV